MHWTTIPQEQTSDDASARTKSSTFESEDVSFAWCSCAADGEAVSAKGEGGKSDANTDPNPAEGDATEASPCADSGDRAVVQAEKDAQGRAVYRGWLEAPRGARKEVYSGENLDVLAMHFAVVKVCCDVCFTSLLPVLCCLLFFCRFFCYKDFSHFPYC